MKETKNNYKSKVEGHKYIDLNHFISILNFLTFWGPNRSILAFKRLTSKNYGFFHNKEVLAFKRLISEK